jgi:hypothetical protein
MNFADYEALRSRLYLLAEGDDLGATFSVDTLDLIIGLGEERVYHGDAQTPGLRASCMLADLSLTITSNAATLPADLLQLKEVYFSGKAPLDIIPLDRLRALEASGATTGGQACYCAQDGDTLRFWPAASGTVLGRYYKRPQALATVTWANAKEIARYPALFVFATLFEAALFLGMVEKAAVWESRYRQLADGANHSERMRVYGGGPLRMKAR